MGDGEVELSVANDGPALAPGEEARVFEKFFRHAGQPPGGTGLGLAICRAVAEAHGGRIRAENREPRGVAFRVTLPVGGTPPAAPEEAGDERS